MTSRRDYWEEQLATCVEPQPSATRSSWLTRAYARIYRFMLSQYGNEQALPDQAASGQHDLPSVIDADAPPASEHTLGEIRTKLKTIRQAAPQVPVGDLRNGVNQHDWITLAYDALDLDLTDCFHRLRKAGFDCRVFSQAGLKVLQVRVRDFDAARDWLQKHRSEFRPQRRGPQVSPLLSTIVFAIVLLMCLPAFVAVLGTWDGKQLAGYVAVAALSVLIAVFGLLLLKIFDLCRRHPLRP